MARKPKALALHLVRTVYNATDKPMQWRSLEGLVVPETAEALRYAEERGWDLGAGRTQRVPHGGRPAIDGPIARPIVKVARLDEAAADAAIAGSVPI